VRWRGRRTSRAALWGYLGALLLAAGCFAPVAARPGGGAATLLSTDSILARLILVAAFSSVALLLLRRRRALLIPGAFAGLMVLAEFLAYQGDLIVVPGTGSSESAILSSFANEWGWAPLAIGVALLLLAGLFPGRRTRST
jgi:uncharacterized membrane protein YhaH (DUF805 family)